MKIQQFIIALRNNNRQNNYWQSFKGVCCNSFGQVASQTGLLCFRQAWRHFVLHLFFHRTPSKCYMQSVELEVNQQVAGECGKPNKTDQNISYGVAEFLSCPLQVYIDTLKSYKTPSSLRWYTVSHTENGREHLISYNFSLDALAHFWGSNKNMTINYLCSSLQTRAPCELKNKTKLKGRRKCFNRCRWIITYCYICEYFI